MTGFFDHEMHSENSCKGKRNKPFGFRTRIKLDIETVKGEMCFYVHVFPFLHVIFVNFIIYTYF